MFGGKYPIVSFGQSIERMFISFRFETMKKFFSKYVRQTLDLLLAGMIANKKLAGESMSNER